MISVRRAPGPDSQPAEIVERKGLGHPDTLADALAERMSVAYSRHCLEHYGVVLHHNLDKLYLRGGHCQIGLGTFEMTEPTILTIGGRVSTSFADSPVGHRELFEQVARDYFGTVLPSFDHARPARWSPVTRR
jgi:S-adenosylmethionine synthetase